MRVGINGAGRIGRALWRVSLTRPGVSVVAVNDLTAPPVLARLLAHDSVRGPLPVPVYRGADGLLVDGAPVRTFACAKPGEVPWGQLGVDVVVEATGRFFAADDARQHLAAGARRVVVSTATVDADVHVFPGVNDAALEPARHRLISPGCCTGTASAPILAALRPFGLRSCLMTTVHAYDPTKSVLHDGPHPNLRMGRAAALNIVPAPLKAGSVVALERAFPELTGRIAGLHLRVPVAIGCAVILTVRLARPAAAAELNRELALAAGTGTAGHMTYTEDPIVSTDVVGAAQACIVDGAWTRVSGAEASVLGWYDNEWGFANRLADLVAAAGKG
ncbi:MAG TPA: glyceraldehyde 3-phosphate dehydrogenase NAD-binding domain-containing protein [Rugosimonospora sp.]|nr:glyceraldehyde 3-phosphate dehydrogenase NAD-binding domain-containing protein [Rugosimonospora sp.]